MKVYDYNIKIIKVLMTFQRVEAVVLFCAEQLIIVQPYEVPKFKK